MSITRRLQLLFLLLTAFAVWTTLALVREPSNDRQSAQAAANNRSFDAVIVTLHPTGFEPAAISSTGRFLLVVNNRSNFNDISLKLARETGEREHEVRIKGGKLDWQQPLDLRPGQYLVTERDHPEWICRLTITAR